VREGCCFGTAVCSRAGDAEGRLFVRGSASCTSAASEARGQQRVELGHLDVGSGRANLGGGGRWLSSERDGIGVGELRAEQGRRERARSRDNAGDLGVGRRGILRSSKGQPAATEFAPQRWPRVHAQGAQGPAGGGSHLNIFLIILRDESDTMLFVRG
jgi:hypothetical protein